MADYRNVDAKQGSSADQPQRQTAAQKAAAAIVGDITGNLDPKLLGKLHDALLAHNPHEGRAAVRKAVIAGVPAEDIADFYVPALARAFGDLWCEDELSFGEVTIAVSRLQTVLRDLEIFWPSADLADRRRTNQATLMLVVPQDVFHTLGAFVLCGQLRRKGISVKMLLGGNVRTINDELSKSAFGAVFISASQRETLESLRHIIDAVQAATDDVPPTVIGGGILDVVSAETVMAETGVSYATRNTEEALRHCGLLLAKQAHAPTSDGG